MADQKVTELTAKSGIGASDVLYVIDGGTTSKKVSNIAIADGASVSGTNTGDQTLPGVLPTVEVTDAAATMAGNRIYVANRADLVTLTLPATAAVGTVIIVVGQGAGKWFIAQNAGQKIWIGNDDSTEGAAGGLDTIHDHASLMLVCTVADTVFNVVGMSGTITTY